MCYPKSAEEMNLLTKIYKNYKIIALFFEISYFKYVIFILIIYIIYIRNGVRKNRCPSKKRTKTTSLYGKWR